MAQAKEHLPSKCEVLCSNPSTAKKKKMYRVFMKMNTWAEVEWGDKNKEERRIKVN
jgi:hypothetical protein